MLQHAFKEWAVVCKALADGRQAMIIRKGGIAEPSAEFHLEHTRFWLYPTYVHQQQAGIKPEAQPLLEQVEAERPPAGVVRLSHFAEVTGVYHIHDIPAAVVLGHLHIWSDATVDARFAYRWPGLYVMPVRVYRAAQVFDLPETPQYKGCRSWLELEQALPTDGAAPVLDDTAYHELEHRLDLLLNPTALA